MCFRMCYCCVSIGQSSQDQHANLLGYHLSKMEMKKLGNGRISRDICVINNRLVCPALGNMPSPANCVASDPNSAIHQEISIRAVKIANISPQPKSEKKLNVHQMDPKSSRRLHATCVQNALSGKSRSQCTIDVRRIVPSLAAFATHEGFALTRFGIRGVAGLPRFCTPFT